MAFCPKSKSLCIVKYICSESVLLIFGLIAIFVMIGLYIISSPVFLLRLLVKKSAKIIRPDLTAIVSSQGNFFSAELFSSKAPRCSLVVPIVIQGHFPESEFHRRLTIMVNHKDKETGKELYPEYKQYVENWMGFAFWKNDPHFDIRNHVKLHNCDDHPVTEPQLCQIVEDLLNKRFQQRRSPWEMYIVNNYNDPELPEGSKTVMIFRVHHTLADGFSILYSLIEGLLQSPMSSIELPKPTFASRDKWGEFWFRLTFPIRLVHDVGNYFIKGARKHPLNIPDSKKSWKQIYGRTKPVPIQKIKEIKDGLGVTFTSVMLAAVAASMSAIVRAKFSKKHESSDRAAFFIPLPVASGHPNAMINDVTGAQIDLPMESFSDPTLRVIDCDKQLRQQKASTIPALLHFFARTLGRQFSFVVGKLTANRVNIAGLTSFAIGLNEIYFESNSDQNAKVYSVVLAAGALIGVSGAAIMAMSYNKNIYFSVTAETACLTKNDIDGLLTLLSEEIDVLHKIVSEKTK